MFFNLIFVIVFSFVSTIGLFSQDVNIDAVENATEIVVEDVDTAASENTSGSFFDILPVDENATNTQNRPAFLDDIENRGGGSSSITSVFVRAVAGIIFFFGIFYMLYKYLRKRSKVVLGSGDIIKILATTALAQNKSLSIVEIVDNMYFISTTDKAISMMSEITDKDTKDAIRLAYAKSSENVVEEPFSSMFDKALVMLNVKKKSEEKEPIEVTKEMTEKIRMMDDSVKNHLNNNDDTQQKEVVSNATISFDKISKYVENDAVGNKTVVDSDIDEEVTTTVSKTKKKVSKKSSKK